MTKRVSLAAALLLFAASAQAAIVLEAEVNGTATNNTIGTAQGLLPGDFTTPTPATVFGSGPTATILGAGGGSDVDFYQFAAVGGAYLFDIDNDPFSFDTILSLFDSTGTLIAYDDDSVSDAGSQSELDSFIGSITLAPGTYYIAVSQYANFATATFTAGGSNSLVRPDSVFGGTELSGATAGDSSFGVSGTQDGNPYALHISQYAPAAVPEPSSMVLASIGGLLAFVGRTVRRRRN